MKKMQYLVYSLLATSLVSSSWAYASQDAYPVTQHANAAGSQDLLLYDAPAPSAPAGSPKNRQYQNLSQNSDSDSQAYDLAHHDYDDGEVLVPVPAPAVRKPAAKPMRNNASANSLKSPSRKPKASTGNMYYRKATPARGAARKPLPLKPVVIPSSVLHLTQGQVEFVESTNTYAYALSSPNYISAEAEGSDKLILRARLPGRTVIRMLDENFKTMRTLTVLVAEQTPDLIAYMGGMNSTNIRSNAPGTPPAYVVQQNCTPRCAPATPANLMNQRR